MPDNSIWLREQNRTIPNDNGLYIAVGLVSAQTIANITEIQDIDGVTNELNQVTQQEAIQIDIFSSAKNTPDSVNNKAYLRHWEVIAALQSIYAQQAQEENYFKIARIPRSFVDTSSAEGGSMLQRYSITIICLVWYRKMKPLTSYFDQFPVRIDNDKTIATPIPLFELTAGN